MGGASQAMAWIRGSFRHSAMCRSVWLGRATEGACWLFFCSESGTQCLSHSNPGAAICCGDGMSSCNIRCVCSSVAGSAVMGIEH